MDINIKRWSRMFESENGYEEPFSVQVVKITGDKRERLDRRTCHSIQEVIDMVRKFDGMRNMNNDDQDSYLELIIT